MKVKLSDFSEEIRYVVECPECGDCYEGTDDPAYEESFYCEGCQKIIAIEDDL